MQDLVFSKKKIFLKIICSGSWMPKVMIYRFSTTSNMHWCVILCSWSAHPCLWIKVKSMSMWSILSTLLTWQCISSEIIQETFQIFISRYIQIIYEDVFSDHILFKIWWILEYRTFVWFECVRKCNFGCMKDIFKISKVWDAHIRVKKVSPKFYLSHFYIFENTFMGLDLIEEIHTWENLFPQMSLYCGWWAINLLL